MAIKGNQGTVTLDGLVHTLDDRDRVAAQIVQESVNDITGGVNIAPVILTPAASVTLTKEANSGRLNLIPSVATSNDEYVLPVAAAAGETYEIAWSGIAADADDILFVAPSADGLTFTGGVLQFDTDEAGVGGYTIAFPGSDDDKLTIVNPESFCIKFVATTTTNYHVSGYAMSTDTAVAFGDQ